MAEHCSKCGAQVTVGNIYCDKCGTALATEDSISGSSLKQGTSEVSGWCIVLVILSIISLVLGGVLGVIGWAGIGAAVVFVTLARIAQAGRQHAEMMDELRKEK